MIPAEIVFVTQATPTIRVLRLRPEGEFSFKAGQWMDCYRDLPEGRRVAGYTMTSSPAEKTVELAVRFSESNPVTAWIHREAKPGDRLFIDGGHGDTYYEAGMADRLFLVAGGIGVTPIMSILRYVADTARKAEATLLYSARTRKDLIYYDEINGLTGTGRIKAYYTVTREAPPGWAGFTGRVNAAMLGEVGVDPEALHYVCGPKEMIQDTVLSLGGLGVRRNRMKHEVWW